MKIDVTAEHIKVAVRGNSHHCMIAEAIKDAVPEAKKIVVDLQSIRWSDNGVGVRYFYFTPPVAQEALLAFDKGKTVRPFSIDLKRPVVRPVGLLPDMVTQTTKRTEQEKEGKIAPGNRLKVRVRLRATEREFGICRLKDAAMTQEEG